MIFSLGYERTALAVFRGVLRRIDGVLLDVRGAPRSRRREFSRANLEREFGADYEWRGDRLGNLAGHSVTRAGLEELIAEKRNVLLMCLERAPAECHRHHFIAMPLARNYDVDVFHVFGEDVIRASELDASIAEERDYLSESLESVLRRG